MSPKDYSAAALLDTMTSDTAKRKGVGLTPVGLERPLEVSPTADGSPQAPPIIPAAFETADLPPTLLERLMSVSREAQRVAKALKDIEHDLNRSVGANMEADYFATHPAMEKGLRGEASPDAVALATKVFGADIVETVVGAGVKPETVAAFAEDFAAKSEAAQAATFKAPAPAGWACPTHGLAVEAVSPKGRHYMKCTECKEFEK